MPPATIFRRSATEPALWPAPPAPTIVVPAPQPAATRSVVMLAAVSDRPPLTRRMIAAAVLFACVTVIERVVALSAVTSRRYAAKPS